MNNIKIYKFIVILFQILFLSISSFAQEGSEKNQIPKKLPFYIETHLFLNDSTFTCYLSYKIPLNNLLFVKKNNHYSSGYSVNFELYKNDKFVKRFFGTGKVVTPNYSNTISDYVYHEGVISFHIGEGEFLINPSITLSNTDIEAKIKPITLVVDSSKINRPIFVKTAQVECDSVKYELVNFQNSVPFSELKYDMLIPINANWGNEISLIVTQQNQKIFEKRITDYEYLNNNITECKQNIVLGSNINLPLIKFIKINFINKKLVEGEFEIELKIGEEVRKFNSPVLWYDKPKSLDNIEDAIEYLEIIGFRNSADSLLDFSDEEEYKALFNFWRKFDEDTSTIFNSVFDEFYSRIDVAKKEFNSLGKNDALKTDRGRTYIIYGKPDSIERKFNDVYDIIEVWDYNELNTKMIFSDKTGTGKFERIK